jgi:hypothetical protein
VRIKSGQKIPTSVRWIPRIGVTDSLLIKSMDPNWAGIAHLAGTPPFKALFPRPSKYSVTFYNTHFDTFYTIDCSIYLSIKMDGTTALGYHEDYYAFMWSGQLTIPSFPFQVLYAAIFPRITTLTGDIGPGYPALPPPVPTPPANEYYYMGVNFGYPGTGGWRDPIGFIGEMTQDNQCPGIAPPFYPNADFQWKEIHNETSPFISIGRWDVTKITVTDWEHID